MVINDEICAETVHAPSKILLDDDRNESPLRISLKLIGRNGAFSMRISHPKKWSSFLRGLRFRSKIDSSNVAR